MFNTFRLVATTLTIGLGFAAQQAHALDRITARIDSTQPATLVVNSNGESYTKLKTAGTVRVYGYVYIAAGGIGRKIKSWEFWPIFGYGANNSQTLSGHYWYSVSETYPKGARPEKVDEDIRFDVPAQYLDAAAVETCNAHAATLRNGGKSNAQIFGQDRTVKMTVEMGHKLDVTGLKHKDLKEWSPQDLSVKCARFVGPATPQATHLRPSRPAVPVVQAPQQAETTSGRTGRPATLQLRANR